MQKEEYTSRSITQLYLDRIDAIDKKGPAINSVIELNPDALAKTIGARKLIDDMLKQNKLDAICGTSFGYAALIHLVNGDYDTGFYFCPPGCNCRISSHYNTHDRL